MWTIALSTYGVLVAPIQIVAETFSTLALVLLACNIVLATRAPWLEQGLKGLDKLFVTHRLIGLTIGVLVITHFSVVPKTPGLVASKPVGYTTIVLLLTMIFIASAPRFPWRRLVPLKYETWKATHRFNGLFVAAAAWHSLLAPTYVRRVPMLAAYVYGAASLGVLAWIYRETLFARFGPFTGSTVRRCLAIGDGVVEVTLRPEGPSLLRRPGQFAFVSFAEGPSPEQHPFTISSGSAADVRFSIKASGDFTDRLPGGLLPASSAARVEGPYGAFTYSRGRADQLWLAGGIGITPFLSMAADLDDTTRVLLVWSVRERQQAVYEAELTRIARERPNLEFRVHATSERGHIEVAALRLTAEPGDCSAFVCGPVPMRVELVRQLRAVGVPRGEIYFEEFRLR